MWELKYLKIRFEDLKVNLFLLSGSFPRAKNVWTFNLLFRCHRIRIFWWFRYHRIGQIWTVESYYLDWWFSGRFGVDQSCWCEPLRPEFPIVIAVWNILLRKWIVHGRPRNPSFKPELNLLTWAGENQNVFLVNVICQIDSALVNTVTWSVAISTD